MRQVLMSVLALAASCLLCAQNQAIALTTGVDGGVTYSFDSRMVPATGITVEAWITYDDATIPIGGNFWPTVARQNVMPNQESWNLRVSAGANGNRALQFIVRTTTNALHSATYNFAPGEFLGWTHIAGTFDGQEIKLIKDGVEVATFTIPGVSNVVNNGGDLRVGNGDPSAPGNETWNGSIDELRIWPMARTAGEVFAARNLEMQGMPGSLLVFPFNGNYVTEDASLTGAPFGTVAFTAGEPSIQPSLPLIFQIGPPSSTCARQAELLVGSVPQIGNQDFTFWCIHGPTPAESPAGAVFAASNYTAGLPQVLGITLNIDPGTILASQIQTPPSNQLGNANFVLPIPNQAIFIGASWVFQWVFIDPNCGSLGFSASNGLLFSVQ